MNVAKINVGNSRCYITTPLPVEVVRRIDDALSYGVEGAFFTQLYKDRKWDGKQHMFSTKTFSFPTGLLTDVLDILETCGTKVEAFDMRGAPPIGEAVLPMYAGAAWSPWAHQQEALNTMIANHRGLIQISTGGGKTAVIAMMYGSVNVPGIVITQQSSLMYQLQAKLSEMLGIKVGCFGDGVFEYGKLTVCMAQSLASLLRATKGMRKDKDAEYLAPEEYDKKSEGLIAKDPQHLRHLLIDTPQFVAADEVHRIAAAGSYSIVQNMRNAYWRFGYSATAYGFREDKKDYLIRAAIGNVLYSAGVDTLVDENILVPVNVYGLDFSHRGAAYPDSKTYNGLYTHAVSQNDARNQLVISSALSAYNAGKNVLIAVTRVEHGKLLEAALQQILSRVEVKFVYGADDTATRDHLLSSFGAGRLPILISTLVKEGIDIPSLDVVISARAESSRISTIQLMGRCMRSCPGKKCATYIDVMDRQHKWLGRHSKVRMSIFESAKSFKVQLLKRAVLPEDFHVL